MLPPAFEVISETGTHVNRPLTAEISCTRRTHDAVIQGLLVRWQEYTHATSNGVAQLQYSADLRRSVRAG